MRRPGDAAQLELCLVPVRHVRATDGPLLDRLQALHERLNVQRFGGELRGIPVRVSRRMKTRLGHYVLAGQGVEVEIVISTRHIRRDGWAAATDTLLHEMVHQWQDESGLPVDHGAGFRRKAREVGASPRARRPVERERVPQGFPLVSGPSARLG